MKIKELRKKQNLTQLELANKIGVVESAISLYESGKREPDISTLIKLADCLNTSIDELVEHEFSKTQQTKNNQSQKQEQEQETMTEQEKQLLTAFRALPDNGRRQFAIGTIESLAKIDKTAANNKSTRNSL